MSAETPFPLETDFMTAGIDLGRCLELKRRWPVLTEDERQAVVRRVVSRRDTSLEELLK